MVYAPVIIPTLNRYQHFKRCLESLERCKWADKTDVYVGLDYPPSEKYGEGWKEIDAYLQKKEVSNGFAKLTVFRRTENLGVLNENGNSACLYRYISDKYDRFIFSEDDNEFSPCFLEYMDVCLEKYENDPTVFAINGFSNPLKWYVSEGATVMKQNYDFSAWGTGYWIDKKNDASSFIRSGGLLDKVEEAYETKAYKKMIMETRRGYFSTALGKVRKKNSWYLMSTDVALTAYLPVTGKYVIMPTLSYVRNLGFDGGGDTCPDFSKLGLDTSHVTKYNFGRQPIDEKFDFQLVEDTLNDIATNKSLLEKFKNRPFNYCVNYYLTICILKIFGFSLGKKMIQLR